MSKITPQMLTDAYLSAGKSLNEPNPDGYTAVMVAACFGNEAALTDLLSRRILINGVEYPAVHIDALTRYANSAAHLALRNEQYGTLKILVEAGADIDNPTFDGLTIRQKLPALAQQGIQITVPDVQRITGLSTVEIQQMRYRGQTPIQLEIARKAGYSDNPAEQAANGLTFVKTVLNANNRQKNSSDSDGWPYISRVILALSLVPECTKPHDLLRKLFQECLERDNLDMPNRFGMTPLMIAVTLDNEAVVDRLLEHDANINAVNIYRENAGHLAYYNIAAKKEKRPLTRDDFDILKELFEYGIDTTHRSFGGLCLNDSAILDNIEFQGAAVLKKAFALRKFPTIQSRFDLPFLSRLILEEAVTTHRQKESKPSILFRWLFKNNAIYEPPLRQRTD